MIRRLSRARAGACRLAIAFGAGKPQPRGVNKLCTLGGATVGGYIGWFLCDGFGMLAAFIASGVGSVVGVYLGWKLAQKFGG